MLAFTGNLCARQVYGCADKMFFRGQGKGLLLRWRESEKLGLVRV